MFPAAQIPAAQIPAPRHPLDDEGRASGNPRQRRGRGRGAQPPQPLGSLTQREHQTDLVCRACSSAHITRLSMSLTDGTPVDFISCHRCEHRTWEHAGTELPVDAVLDRTRKL